MASFLDKSGFQYFWGKLKSYIDLKIASVPSGVPIITTIGTGAVFDVVWPGGPSAPYDGMTLQIKLHTGSNTRTPKVRYSTTTGGLATATAYELKRRRSSTNNPGNQTQWQFFSEFSLIQGYPISITFYQNSWIVNEMTRPVYTDLMSLGVCTCIVPAATTGTISLNLNLEENGNIFKVTPSGDITLSLSSAAPSPTQIKKFGVIIVMGATLRNVTWFSDLTWLEGAPALETNKIHRFSFEVHSTGVGAYKIAGNLAYKF
jgi:hypothetical protein